MCVRRDCRAANVFLIDSSSTGVCPQHLVEAIADRLHNDQIEVVVRADHTEWVAELAAAAG